MLLERIFLAFTGFAFLVYGAFCLFRPETLVEVAQFDLSSDVARVEVRAMYGGLQMAIGLLSFAGLGSGFRRTAIGALTFLFIGLAVGRGYGMLVDSMPGQYNQIAIGYELVSAAIAGFLSLNADKNALQGW